MVISSVSHSLSGRLRKGAHTPVVLVIDTELDPSDPTAAGKLCERLSRVVPRSWRIARCRFTEVSPALVRRLRTRFIVLSGQGTPWIRYPEESITRFRDFLDHTDIPVLGICGGHQLLALAYGEAVAPIRGTLKGNSYRGMYAQHGYTAVQLDRECELFRSVPSPAWFWENHVEEVKRLPDGFTRIATEDESPVQAMRHTSRPLFGVQFHPERFSTKYPAGCIVLRNFFHLEA
ncbi:MAG: gamma-glutamyl-gamma-aminobutyrate hydrolase family protein [Bacteroidota bacterium]|nr:gamma-glutamyl-gamma-aminobutyrate hydrolase family protein [Bacteroidota bacterium]